MKASTRDSISHLNQALPRGNWLERKILEQQETLQRQQIETEKEKIARARKEKNKTGFSEEEMSNGSDISVKSNAPGKHYILKKWWPPDRPSNEDANSPPIHEKETAKTAETKADRNLGKFSKLKTTSEDFDRNRGNYLESTTTSEELVRKDSNGSKEADSTTDLKVDEYILEKVEDKESTETEKIESQMNIKKEINEDDVIEDLSCKSTAKDSMTKSTRENVTKSSSVVTTPPSLTSVSTPPCITINENSMQIRVSIPGHEKSKPPTLSRLDNKHEKEIVTLVNKCHSMFSNLMGTTENLVATTEQSEHVHHTSSNKKNLESRRRISENENSELSLEQLERKKLALIEDIKELEYEKMKGIQDLQTIQLQKEKIIQDFEKMLLEVGSSTELSSATLNRNVADMVPPGRRSSELGTLSPPNSIEDKSNSQPPTVVKKDETLDEQKYELKLKDIPALSLNKNANKQQEETGSKKQEKNIKVPGKKEKNKLRECLQGDKSRDKSSTTPPDKGGDHQSTDPPVSRAEGKAGAQQHQQHPGNQQHPGIYHQLPKFSVYPAHYAHIRKRVGSAELSSSSDFNIAEQRSKDLKILESRSPDPQQLETSLPLLHPVDPKILEILDPKSLDSKYLYQRIIDARFLDPTAATSSASHNSKETPSLLDVAAFQTSDHHRRETSALLNAAALQSSAHYRKEAGTLINAAAHKSGAQSSNESSALINSGHGSHETAALIEEAAHQSSAHSSKEATAMLNPVALLSGTYHGKEASALLKAAAQSSNENATLLQVAAHSSKANKIVTDAQSVAASKEAAALLGAAAKAQSATIDQAAGQNLSMGRGNIDRRTLAHKQQVALSALQSGDKRSYDSRYDSRFQAGAIQQMANKDNIEPNVYQDFPPYKKIRHTSPNNNGPLNLHIGSSQQQQINLPSHLQGGEGREGVSGDGREQLYLRAKTLQELSYPGHGGGYEYPHHQYYQSKYPYMRQGDHHRRLIDSSMELQQQQQHHAALMANSSNHLGASKAHQAGPSLTPRQPTHRLPPHLQYPGSMHPDHYNMMYHHHRGGGIHPSFDPRMMSRGGGDLGTNAQRHQMGKYFYDRASVQPHTSSYHQAAGNIPKLWKPGYQEDNSGSQNPAGTSHQHLGGSNVYPHLAAAVSPAASSRNSGGSPAAGSIHGSNKNNSDSDLQPVISPQQFSQEMPQPARIRRLSNSCNIVTPSSSKFKFRVAQETSPPQKPENKREGESTGTKCENCGENAQFMCSNCKASHYCSTKCQRDKWQSHLMVCRALPSNH